MDIEGKDVTLGGNGHTMYEMRLKFEDATIISPTELYKQVKDMVIKNTKDVRNTVGRVGNLVIGTQIQGGDLFFALGWYFRKACESLEKEHGPVKIQYESENVSRDMLKQFFTNFTKREGEKLLEISKEIAKGNMDEGFSDDDDD